MHGSNADIILEGKTKLTVIAALSVTPELTISCKRNTWFIEICPARGLLYLALLKRNQTDLGLD